MAYNPDNPVGAKNFFALLNKYEEVVMLISFDKKEGMFERVDGAWEKITKESAGFIHGLKVMYVSTEVIEMIDEMYQYSDPYRGIDLEKFSTKEIVNLSEHFKF
jgi:hypothetical protein